MTNPLFCAAQAGSVLPAEPGQRQPFRSAGRSHFTGDGVRTCLCVPHSSFPSSNDKNHFLEGNHAISIKRLNLPRMLKKFYSIMFFKKKKFTHMLKLN